MRRCGRRSTGRSGGAAASCGPAGLTGRVRQGGIKGAHTGKRADGVKAYVDAMLKAIQVCARKPAAGLSRDGIDVGACGLRFGGLRVQWVAVGLCARACMFVRAGARDLLHAFALGCTWIRRFR